MRSPGSSSSSSWAWVGSTCILFPDQLQPFPQGRNAEALIKALQILYVAGADPQSAIFNDPVSGI
jgi:hypothetical protein